MRLWDQILPGLPELPGLRARLPLALRVLMARQEQERMVLALLVLERTRPEPERSVLLVLRTVRVLRVLLA